MDPELQPELRLALDKGLDFLHRRQGADGGFNCYLGTDAALLEPAMVDSCIFPVALLAGCLLFLEDDPRADEILTRVTDYLLRNRERCGLWSHVPVGHYLRGIIPPDVDDTASVSHILRARKVQGRYSENVPLLLVNRNDEGLFFTWYVCRLRWITNIDYWNVTLREWRRPRRNLQFWRDCAGGRHPVDGVVNANVLYYLGDRPETQPVVDFLLGIIAEHREADCDLWYRDPHIVYYFFSRNWARGITRLEPAREPMIARILASAQTDGRLGETVLDTAMAVCVLLDWGAVPPELEKAVRFLLRTQEPGGEWPRWQIYYGGPSRDIGWGSEAMTTAFCLEALARYRRRIASPSPAA